MQRLFALLSLVLCTFSAAGASPLTAVGSSLFISDLSDQSDTFWSNKETQQGTIIDRLRGDKRFSRFVEALSQERGLRDDLENRDKRATVFAPTNDAWKRIEDELRNKQGNRPQMGDILRYHICPDMEVRGDRMHQGQLLRTDLRLKKLNDRHQRIRVFRFHGDIWLNMRSRMVERDMEAENGRIHVIDRVLMPPSDLREMLYMVPTAFSTFLAAAERTGMSQKMCSENGMTVFAPSNEAWERLGFENLRHLFSCAGQREHNPGRKSGGRDREPECKGVQDLKKILEYHMGRDVAWTTDMMEKREMRMKTMYRDEMLTLQAKERRSGGGRHDRDNSYCPSKGGDDNKEHDVRRYVFLINNGEARVQFTDGLAENGVIHMIDDIMVPRDVKLPHDRMQ